jgi:plasmid stabilization system protein ParE
VTSGHLWRLSFHPDVAADLDEIADWIAAYAGLDAAERRLAEIEATLASLREIPHKGSLRDDISPGLRAIPAGRRAVIVFTVDEARREVRVHAITFAGADWAYRSRLRR